MGTDWQTRFGNWLGILGSHLAALERLSKSAMERGGSTVEWQNLGQKVVFPSGLSGENSGPLSGLMCGSFCGWESWGGWRRPKALAKCLRAATVRVGGDVGRDWVLSKCVGTLEGPCTHSCSLLQVNGLKFKLLLFVCVLSSQLLN